MNILLIGSGGREHALAWALADVAPDNTSGDCAWQPRHGTTWHVAGGGGG